MEYINILRMRKQRKQTDPKTTAIGILLGVVVIGSMVPAILGKITFSEASAFIGTVGTTLAGLGFYFSKDKTKEAGDEGQN
jgi:hypothetical protein